MRNKATGIICAAVTILYMLVIFMLSSQNGEETAKTSVWLAEMLAKVFCASPGAEEIRFVHLALRKAAHVVLFGGAGVLVTLSLSFLTNRRMRLCVWVSAAVTCGAAFFDEWHKQFIYGRHFDVPEAFLNVFSGLGGIVLAALVIKRLRKKEKAG